MGSSDQKASDVTHELIMSFDSMVLSEEIKKARQETFSGRHPKDKLLIHMCYLLTDRFEPVQESVFRLLKAFIPHLSMKDDKQIIKDYLVILSETKAKKSMYESWTEVIGAFMSKMGASEFFGVLPLQLLDYDLFSLTYA
jgi:hypothetical protein